MRKAWEIEPRMMGCFLRSLVTKWSHITFGGNSKKGQSAVLSSAPRGVRTTRWKMPLFFTLVHGWSVRVHGPIGPTSKLALDSIHSDGLDFNY